MNTKRADELERYPKYKQAYMRAFERLLKNRIDAGLETTWNNPEEMLKWWLQTEE